LHGAGEGPLISRLVLTFNTLWGGVLVGCHLSARFVLEQNQHIFGTVLFDPAIAGVDRP
jgi:hypothetical protein